MTVFPKNQVRVHGRTLVTLGTLGITCVAAMGFMLTMMSWLPDWAPQASVWTIAGIEWKQAVVMNTTGKWLLSTAGMLWTLAYLTPLIALRRLGRCLYANEALSRPVADAFRWLAHSVLGFALFNAGSIVLAAIAAEGNHVPQHDISISVAGCYLFLIACLCLYSVAHLMQLATEAADDAQSIV